MDKTFIKNHQYNLIKKQVDFIQQVCNTISNSEVLEAIKYDAYLKIIEKFPNATELERNILGKILTLNSTEECQDYIRMIQPFLEEFTPVTKQLIKKLFSKAKNLKVPDLSMYDFRYITYLSWTDIATNQLFIVYHLNGQVIGIEGKFSLVNQKGVCFACNKLEEVALFTAIANAENHQTNYDNYKVFGNYLCINVEVCNKNITDITRLETFIKNVVGI